MKTKYYSILLGLISGAASAQTTNVVDFSGSAFVHGKMLDGSEFSSAPGSGFTFRLDGANGIDTAIIFDTNQTGTADSDLEYPFSGGNLKGARLDQVLIFADNLDGGKDGIVDRPNDSARGGILEFHFNSDNVTDFGFALVDAPETQEVFGITFEDSNGSTKKLTLAEFLAVSGTDDFVAGDNFANQFAQTSATSLGLQNIKNVSLDLKASGGVDNLTWTEGAIPEPSTGMLSLVALGMAFRRRR